MPKQREQDQAANDHEKDRYPTFKEAIRRISEQDAPVEGPVERVEMTFLASGEATYRVWGARAVEPEGGYLPPASS